MGKRFGSASLSGTVAEGDPFADARKVNRTSRDALPALPLGDVGYGAPDALGKYAENDEAPQVRPHPNDTVGLSGTSASDARKDIPLRLPTQPRQAAPRQMSHDEMLAMANSMIDQQASQHSAQLDQGSSTGDRDASGGKIPEWLTRSMKEER